MSMVSTKGIYLGTPEKTTVDAKDTGSVQFAAVFRCTHIRNGNDWTPLDGDQRITAFLNLVTKSGALNEINVRSLKDSLGWDGKSFATLQRDDWSGTECQLVVDEEEYNGRKSLKVQYVNPKDYTPSSGLGAADPQMIQSLDSKYGALLRAMNGGNGGRPATGKPAKNPVAPNATQSVGKDLAWAAFNHTVDEYGGEHPDDAYTQERRTRVFKDIVTEIAKERNKSTKDLGPADWAQVKKEIEEDFDAAIEGFIPV
jgi:hypothetical protein